MLDLSLCFNRNNVIYNTYAFKAGFPENYF